MSNNQEVIWRCNIISGELCTSEKMASIIEKQNKREDLVPINLILQATHFYFEGQWLDVFERDGRHDYDDIMIELVVGAYDCKFQFLSTENGIKDKLVSGNIFIQGYQIYIDLDEPVEVLLHTPNINAYFKRNRNGQIIRFDKGRGRVVHHFPQPVYLVDEEAELELEYIPVQASAFESAYV
jgi:hypothetical protein